MDCNRSPSRNRQGCFATGADYAWARSLILVLQCATHVLQKPSRHRNRTPERKLFKENKWSFNFECHSYSFSKPWGDAAPSRQPSRNRKPSTRAPVFPLFSHSPSSSIARFPPARRFVSMLVIPAALLLLLELRICIVSSEIGDLVGRLAVGLHYF